MKKLLILVVLAGLFINSSIVLAQQDGDSREVNEPNEINLNENKPVENKSWENKSEEQSIWSDISSSAKSLTNNTLVKAGELSVGLGNIYDDAVILSKDSLNNFRQRLDESVELLERLGYDITDVYINVGLIPDLSFKVARVKTITKDEQNEILQQRKVGAVMDYILNKLNQAYDMKVQGYQIKDVKIRLTLSPGATVHFVQNLNE